MRATSNTFCIIFIRRSVPISPDILVIGDSIAKRNAGPFFASLVFVIVIVDSITKKMLFFSALLVIVIPSPKDVLGLFCFTCYCNCYRWFHRQKNAGFFPLHYLLLLLLLIPLPKEMLGLFSLQWTRSTFDSGGCEAFDPKRIHGSSFELFLWLSPNRIHKSSFELFYDCLRKRIHEQFFKSF